MPSSVRHTVTNAGVGGEGGEHYRGTALISNSADLGAHSRAMPGPGPMVVLVGGELVFMSEVRM